MRNGSMVLAGLFTVAALVGCGSSSSGGGGGSFSTSAPSSTKLTGLSSAQAAQLCTDLLTYETKEGSSLAPMECKLEGVFAALAAQSVASAPLTDAQLQAACTSGVSDCMSADASTDNSDTCTSTTFAGEPTTCTSTVGDVEKCAADQVTQATQLFAAVPSCSSLTAANLATATAPDAGIVNTADPASCQPIEANCLGSTANAGFIGRKTGTHRK
jgi:hypothetical protein